jgi:hypothetical protein
MHSCDGTLHEHMLSEVFHFKIAVRCNIRLKRRVRSGGGNLFAEISLALALDIILCISDHVDSDQYERDCNEWRRSSWWLLLYDIPELGTGIRWSRGDALLHGNDLGRRHVHHRSCGDCPRTSIALSPLSYIVVHSLIFLPLNFNYQL